MWRGRAKALDKPSMKCDGPATGLGVRSYSTESQGWSLIDHGLALSVLILPRTARTGVCLLLFSVETGHSLIVHPLIESRGCHSGRSSSSMCISIGTWARGRLAKAGQQCSAMRYRFLVKSLVRILSSLIVMHQGKYWEKGDN